MVSAATPMTMDKTMKIGMSSLFISLAPVWGKVQINYSPLSGQLFKEQDGIATVPARWRLNIQLLQRF
jgi:hypothetical protein